MKLVKRGQNNVEEALEELGLNQITPPGYKPRSNKTLTSIAKQFKVMARITCAARMLGRTVLRDVCYDLLGLLHFVARFKLKKTLKYTINRAEVLETMEVMLSSMISFLKSIGDTNGEARLMQLQQVVQRATHGDKDAMNFLEMDEPVSISMQSFKKVPRFSRMQIMYSASQTMSVIGQHMKDDITKTVNLAMCSFLDWMATEAYPDNRLVTAIDGADACDSLLEELNCLCKLVQNSELRMRQWNIAEMERACEDLEEQMDDPTFIPGSDSSESESEEDTQSVQKEEIAQHCAKIPSITSRKGKRKATQVQKTPIKKAKVAYVRTSTSTAPRRQETRTSNEALPEQNTTARENTAAAKRPRGPSRQETTTSKEP